MYFAVQNNLIPVAVTAKNMCNKDLIWVLIAVILVLVLVIVVLLVHKRIKLCQTIKTKVTTLKKCSGPKGEGTLKTLKHYSLSKM